MRNKIYILAFSLFAIISSCSSADSNESKAPQELNGKWAFTTGRKDTLEIDGRKVEFEYLTEGELILNTADNSYEIVAHTSMVKPQYIQHAFDCNYGGDWSYKDSVIVFTSKGGDDVERMTAIEKEMPLDAWTSKTKRYSNTFKETVTQLTPESMITVDSLGIKTHYLKTLNPQEKQ